MSKTVRGLILTRLMVVLAIILVPISIFLIYNFANFSLWYTNDPVLTGWLINLIIPLVYSVSWLFFLILFAGRLADTMDSFDEKISVVPSRLKFFYGVNAIYLLFIFIFPLITPVISIVSFASFAWRLTTYRKESWEEDTKVGLLTKVTMVIFALIPIFCTVSIIHQYLNLSFFLWEHIWLPILPYLFMFSYSLFTALAIGSLFIMFSNSGISDYEQFYEGPQKQKQFYGIKVLEFFIFGFLLYLDVSRYLGYNDYNVVDFFYLAGFVIIILTSIVNYIKGKSKYTNFKGHFLGYFIAVVFIGSNVIFTNETISEFLRLWSMLISAILYIFVLLYTFITIE
jgi:hypothetical protein